MALKELKMEDFLGKTVTHSFHQRNRVRGPNGSGKSSIKQAICFLFTGTDAEGSRSPKHLISKDKEGCKVSVVTDKAEISRTLTSKGSSTIKLTRNGVSQALTQAQMEASLGSVDLFLSAFIPGYFLALTPEKQHKIISEVSPKVDRVELIRVLSGIELTAEEQIKYGVSRRVDLVASAVASDRRDADRQASMKSGEVRQLESLAALPDPVYPEECKHIAYSEQLQKAWNHYEGELRAYNNAVARAERIQIENDLRASKRKTLSERLAALEVQAVPQATEAANRIPELVQKYMPMPSPPAVGTVIDADHCPTCGQTVGKSHREQVIQRNGEIMAKYEADVAAAKVHNQQLDKKIEALRLKAETNAKEITRVLEANATAARHRRSIEIEIASLADHELPELPSVKPGAPEENFDLSALEALRSKLKAYEAEVTKFKFVNEQIKTASEKASVLKREVKTLSDSVERLQKLEAAIKQIPQEELKNQMKAFEMKTVTISVGDKVEVAKDGIHYDYLSTGQRAKADVEICQKLNSLMQKPINMIFLDNADLVDEVDWGGQQMFAAFVDKTADGVVIEAV